jgi:FAD/FMN-containing dehydrogenase
LTDLTRRDLVRAGAASAAGLWLPFRADARSAAWHTSAAPRVRRRALAELRRRLRGPLLLPGDPGYGAASSPANGRYDRIRPLAVAVCAGERDVVACIRWAQEHGIQPVARGGGHSYAGYSTTRGLLVDIGRLNRVSVDQRRGIAIMGGGALNQNVFDATADGGWVLPGGTCLGVGVGGLVLGGGIGYNTHWAGLTSDHLRASRIVTAEGKVLELDRSHHRDLFWACRGGAGGSFGVNTSFTFELAKVPRQDVAFYRFDYRGADAAAAVLATFDRILTHAPPAFNAVAMAQASPVGPGGPREAIDVFTRGQYLGPVEELRELVAPLLAAATPTTAVLQTMPYWDMQRLFASRETEHHGFGDVSRYSKAPLPDAVVGKVVDLLAACPARTATTNGSMWSLGWIGGDVVNAVGRRETAYVHRDMLTMLRATPVWDQDAPASVRDGLIAWTNQMIRTVAPYTPRESYQNFPNRGIVDWKCQYYAENYDRLVAVKTKYDRHNLFHNPQSIRPRRRRG